MIKSKKFGIRSASVFNIILPLILFISFFSISNLINFPQNDDWVYRLNVESFLNGNYALHPYLGPTFYVQGFMGAFFAYFFSIEKLPILTLLISTINIGLFLMLLDIKFRLGKKQKLIISLLYFLNPLNLYTTLGFMTSQYFIFFLFLSIIFIEKFEISKSKRHLITAILMSFLGLLVRQVSLVIPLTYLIYNIYKKNHKQSMIGAIWFTSFYGFWDYVFPKTIRMFQIPLQPQHFLDFPYSFAIMYGSLILVTAFLFPMVINRILNENLNAKGLLTALVAAVIIFLTFNKSFQPEAVSWGEFPYFENTFERTGLYPRGIHGTKYQFYGIFDLYKYWDIVAKLVVSLLIPILLLSFKKINFYAVFIVVYISMLVITETFYDRYILVLIPIFLIYFLTYSDFIHDISIAISIIFLAFLAFFGYQLSMDFVLVNRYVWDEANQLYHNDNVDKNLIQATNAWKLLYRNTNKDYTYNFSYDSQNINEDYASKYDLMKSHTIEYPLNFFIEPKIYLYKLKL